MLTYPNFRFKFLDFVFYYILILKFLKMFNLVFEFKGKKYKTNILVNFLEKKRIKIILYLDLFDSNMSIMFRY